MYVCMYVYRCMYVCINLCYNSKVQYEFETVQKGNIIIELLYPITMFSTSSLEHGSQPDAQYLCLT